MSNPAPVGSRAIQVLIVDDDEELAAMVAELLAREGIRTLHAASGAAACEIPILMLTARGDPMDRVLGLEIGADDYLAKPFEPRELVARVRALVRRRALGSRRNMLRFGELVLDLLTRRVSYAGQGPRHGVSNRSALVPRGARKTSTAAMALSMRGCRLLKTALTTSRRYGRPQSYPSTRHSGSVTAAVGFRTPGWKSQLIIAGPRAAWRTDPARCAMSRRTEQRKSDAHLAHCYDPPGHCPQNALTHG